MEAQDGGHDAVEPRAGPRFTKQMVGDLSPRTCPPGGEFHQIPLLPMVLRPQNTREYGMRLWSHLTTSPTQKVLHRNLLSSGRLPPSSVRDILAFIGHDCHVFIMTIADESFETSITLFGEQVNVDRMIMPTFSIDHARSLLDMINFGCDPMPARSVTLKKFLATYEDEMMDRYGCVVDCVLIRNTGSKALLLLDPVPLMV